MIPYLYVGELGRGLLYYWRTKGKGYVNSDAIMPDVNCLVFYFTSYNIVNIITVGMYYTMSVRCYAVR